MAFTARCATVCIARTMLSQDVRPSVCLSVTRRYSIETAKRIMKFFSPSGSHTILFFSYQTALQYYDGDALTGVSNTEEYEKSRFSAIISLYLENGTRAILTIADQY